VGDLTEQQMETRTVRSKRSHGHRADFSAPKLVPARVTVPRPANTMLPGNKA